MLRGGMMIRSVHKDIAYGRFACIGSFFDFTPIWTFDISDFDN